MENFKKIIEFFKTKTRTFTLILLLMFGLFASGIYIGFNNRPEIDKVINVNAKETAVTTEADFSPFWKVWNVLNDKYPDAKNFTDQERVYGAISGLVDSLNDPYTVFFTPEDAKIFEEEI